LLVRNTIKLQNLNVFVLYDDSEVLMDLKLLLLSASILLTSVSVFGQAAVSLLQNGKDRPVQLHPERNASVGAIPGIVAAGAKWARVWQQTGNSADGIVPAKDGSILAAQGEFSRVVRIDGSGNASIYLSDTHAGSALSFDRKGNLYGVQRTPQAIGILAPRRETLADTFKDKPLGDLGNPNDLAADSKGGVYFTFGQMILGHFTLGQVYYAGRTGEITQLSEGLQTNGIVLSRDDKTLYVTNRTSVVAFDVLPNGFATNQRELGRLEGGGIGDGMTIDSDGRLYISTNAGVQILDPDGRYLGLIPTPRDIISVCFGGSEKKNLYVVGEGSKDMAGQEISGRSRTIYRLTMLTRGYRGRAK
jgi:gluconolactonase